MEVARYLCEFFFCDFLHFVMLCLVGLCFAPKVSNTVDSPVHLGWKSKDEE